MESSWKLQHHSLRGQTKMLSIFPKLGSIFTKKNKKPINYLFSSLPNELRLIIAEQLTPKDLNSFLRTCRELYHLLSPLLYNIATQDVRTGYPSLCWAAERGHVSLVKFLLEEKGIDIETRRLPRHGCRILDHMCWTPLHHAVFYKKEEAVKILLQKGAKLEADEILPGSSPLFIAARTRDENVVRLLIEQRPGVDLLLCDEEREWIFSGLVKGGCEATVRMLLERGVKINGEGFEALLHVAVKAGQSTIAKLLLDNGADIEFVGPGGYRPLTLAARVSHGDMIRLLVERGAKLDALRGSTGTSVVHEAVSSYTRFRDHAKLRELIDILLELGANLNMPDSAGETALVQAIKMAQPEIACFLIQRGADVFAKSRLGHQAVLLDWVKNVDDTSVINAVLDKLLHIDSKHWPNAVDVRVFFWAIWAGHEAIVKLLLDRGIDVVNRHYEFEYMEWSTHIILHATSDREGNLGSIALKLALAFGRPRIVNLLKRRGARQEHTAPIDDLSQGCLLVISN